jgi:hypothetical protein
MHKGAGGPVDELELFIIATVRAFDLRKRGDYGECRV